MPDKRVCIVGAGVSGLVTIKECKHVGLNPICFELHSDLGGIWTLDRESETTNSPRLWDTMITNTTKYIHTFSDFHPVHDVPMYMTRKAVGEYYELYAKRFGLREHIRFNTRVVNIRKTPDHATTGQWEVFTCPTSAFRSGNKRAGEPPTQNEINICEKNIFDIVLVCSGFFKVPIYPEVPGLDSFPGSITHTFDYKSSEPFVNKKVLVVGNSFSAGDIACDVSTRTDKAVDLSVGRGMWIIPRVMPGGVSTDRGFNRKGLYSDGAGVVCSNNAMINVVQSRLDHIGNGINPPLPPTNAPYMMGDDIYLKLFSDQIRIQDTLVAFDGSIAKFKDGSQSRELDAVICATGYKLDTSFVDLKVTRNDGVVELYNMMLPINEKHHTLAFVGLLCGDGPPAITAELQARYITQIITGKLQPPSEKAMLENIKYLADMSIDRRGKLGYSLLLFLIADNIAKDLGAFPDYWRVFLRDPLLAYKIWHGPLLSAHYRLLGPDSDWDTARAACYRAYEVMYDIPCNRGRVPITRNDIRDLRKRQVMFAIGTGVAFLAISGMLLIKTYKF